MKLMHCDEIDWLDLPKIESPHLALGWVESHVRVMEPEALSVAGDVIASGEAAKWLSMRRWLEVNPDDDLAKTFELN